MTGDEIKPAKNKLLTTQNTDVEKIVLYLQGKLKRTDLSAKVQEKVDRMKTVSDMIKKYGSRLKVVPMIERVYGLSSSQSLRIFNETLMVFSITAEQVKSRDFWIDILLGQIMVGMEKALKAGDYKAHASYVGKFKETIVDLVGDDEASKYDKIQPMPIVIGFYPEMVMTGESTAEDLMKAAREFRKRKKKAITAVDIDHEPAS